MIGRMASKLHITHFLTIVTSFRHVISVLRVGPVYRTSISAGRKTVHCSNHSVLWMILPHAVGGYTNPLRTNVLQGSVTVRGK